MSAVTRKIAANAANKLNAGGSITKSEREALEQIEREQSAKAAKLGCVENQSAAAVKCGVSVRVVKASKKAGSKAFMLGNRIDCDVLAAELRVGPVPEPVLSESEMLVRERRMALADKRARANREHLHIDEIKRTCLRYVGGMKARLLAMEANVVIQMKAEIGLSEPQAASLRRIQSAEGREVLLALQAGEWFK